jgi:putative ABC transport system permease protein
VAGADVWVLNPHDNQAIDDFIPDGHAGAIARLPGVSGVRVFAGSFLNFGSHPPRRLWVIAWPRGTPLELLSGQILSGVAATARSRIEEGGWIAVSAQVASEHHTGVGGALTLATPTGNIPFRIAATTTNFGWTPGAIVMNISDYSHYWTPTRPLAPSALGVQLDGSVAAAAARSEIIRALGPSSGLEVLTAGERERQIDASASEGLGQLGDIATLLVAAAILALTAAMGSSIWRRRAALAGLRLEGTTPKRLRRMLGIEVALMLSAGCLTGAILGMYGQLVIDSYLKHVTGFPVAGFATGARLLEIFVAVIASVLAITAIPVWFASRVSPTFALDE